MPTEMAGTFTTKNTKCTKEKSPSGVLDVFEIFVSFVVKRPWFRPV
jgi:hypothetical protein